MFYFKILNPSISQHTFPTHPALATLPSKPYLPKLVTHSLIYMFIPIFHKTTLILDLSLQKPNLQPIKILSLNLSTPFQPKPFPVHTHQNLNPQPPAARYKSDPKPQTDHLIPTRGAYFKQVPSKCIVNPM